jgi:hypothetical protein
VPYRVETRFQLERYRDLPPFLGAVVREVRAFRQAPGAEAMWLKGRLWRLQAGSYSEWADREAMLDYARGGGHRAAAQRTQSDWASHTWIAYDDLRAVHHQRCACGAVHRSEAALPRCPDCGRMLRLRLPAPARPRRGVPLTFRITPRREVRRALLASQATRCRVCGADNPRGLAYCATCHSRTRGTRALVTRSTRLELYVFLLALLIVAGVSLYVGTGAALHR